MRLGVLASGAGTILEAILASGLPVAVVAVDRPCRAVEVAEAAGVPAHVVTRESFGADFDRDAFTGRVLDVLGPYDLDVVALAGWGTILGPAIFAAYADRILNTHPSLLPAYGGPGMYGSKVHEAVLAAGDAVSGCSVHLVTEAVDAGPVLARAEVPVEADDTAATLAERVKVAERTLFPATIKSYLASLEGATP